MNLGKAEKQNTPLNLSVIDSYLAVLFNEN